jgi:hypothetical protein
LCWKKIDEQAGTLVPKMKVHYSKTKRRSAMERTVVQQMYKAICMSEVARMGLFSKRIRNVFPIAVAIIFIAGCNPGAIMLNCPHGSFSDNAELKKNSLRRRYIL